MILHKDNRGYASVEMLIVLGIFLFLVFGAIDYWTIMVKVGQVDNLKEYYLDRARLEGWLSASDEAELRQRLNDTLYDDIQITATDSSNQSIKESDGASRLLRNNNSPLDSEFSLSIRCKPNPQPFFAGLLLGKVQADFYIDRGGKALSERVDP